MKNIKPITKERLAKTTYLLNSSKFKGCETAQEVAARGFDLYFNEDIIDEMYAYASMHGIREADVAEAWNNCGKEWAALYEK